MLELKIFVRVQTSAILDQTRIDYHNLYTKQGKIQSVFCIIDIGSCSFWIQHM